MTRRQSTKQLKPVVNILWTGGWDSTFRVPYYLLDKVRQSRKVEMDTIELLTDKILNQKTTLCEINDLIIINVQSRDLPADHRISLAYKALRQNHWFGEQYLWIARLAHRVNGLELSIHRDDKASQALNAFGETFLVSDNKTGNYYKLDVPRSSGELLTVFGGLRFPVLNYSKLDMKMEAEKLGFIEILNKSWFCHNPVKNKPCGWCNPCVYAIEEGLSYRFSKTALARYKIKKYSPIPRKALAGLGLSSVARKVRRLIEKMEPE